MCFVSESLRVKSLRQIGQACVMCLCAELMWRFKSCFVLYVFVAKWQKGHLRLSGFGFWVWDFACAAKSDSD